MIVTKAHLMFEQSGTFKRAFKKFGIPAIDYDILNDFGETDCQIDLFQEINNAYRGGCSVFDNVAETEIAIAFFPCVRFEDQIAMHFRGDWTQMKKMDDLSKLERVYKLSEERQQMYADFLKMAAVALKKGIRLIVENPYSTMHYLTQYFPIKPKLIDKNRRERGDFFKKPTQYWFINCEPENNLIMEPEEDIPVPQKVISKLSGSDKVGRSMISGKYAETFIREFILDGEHI